MEKESYLESGDSEVTKADGNKTKAELLRELNQLRQQVLQLQARQIECHTCQLALEESRARYRVFLQVMPDLILTMSRDGTYLDFKTNNEAILAIPPDQMVKSHVTQVLPTAVAQQALQAIEQACATGSLQTFEYELPLAQGLCYFEARVMPYGLNEVLVIVRDVTDRRQAQVERDALLQQLEAQNQALEDLVTQRTQQNMLLAEAIACTTDGIVITNSQFQYEYVNPAMTQMTGYSREEFLGAKSARLLRSHCHEATFYQEIDETLAKGQIWQGELISRRKDGQLIYQDVTIAPIRNEQGQIAHYIGVRRDITRRKQAEAALHESLEEKNILLQEIHHRVKNNLQIVASLLRLQTKVISSPEVLEPLKESQNRVEAMALIHQKLYQSKNLIRINFADYIKSLAAELYRCYVMDSAQIQMQIEAAEIELSLDVANPCGLILNELISNAFKHAFPGARSGTVQVRFYVKDTDQYVLQVQDNGVGLPQHLSLPKANSLGLRLIASLTRQLRGELITESGEGSSFMLVFRDPASIHLASG